VLVRNDEESNNTIDNNNYIQSTYTTGKFMKAFENYAG
jgi:hypothetical protein